MPRAVPFSVETASCRLPGTDSICSKKVLESEEKVVRLKKSGRGKTSCGGVRRLFMKELQEECKS